MTGAERSYAAWKRWDGAYGTHFWADPKEKLVGIMMIQTDNPDRQLDRDFENAAMQSIVE